MKSPNLYQYIYLIKHSSRLDNLLTGSNEASQNLHDISNKTFGWKDIHCKVLGHKKEQDSMIKEKGKPRLKKKCDPNEKREFIGMRRMSILSLIAFSQISAMQKVQ